MTETTGQKLERYLARAKMQQKELAARLGVEASYVSRMVNDRIGWIHGRYFGQIAAALALTDDEIRELNPAAVVTFATQPIPVPINPHPARPLPDALQEAVQLYGKRFPELRESRWQQYLAGFNWREGEPEHPEAWLDLYRDLSRAGIVPGSN
ncbi:helix-turn-helix domain-containing protein [Deinococcus yunweiensis]|uniref:helix-turn-helix domain-containing protein n=1 Tax=Deinococcus yunweiensis TaxID=367282 RepID=UPI00398E664B